MGPVVADHTARAGGSGRRRGSCGGEARVRRDDDHEKDRHRHHRSRTPRNGLAIERSSGRAGGRAGGAGRCAMTYDEYNAFCRSLPATSCVVQWGGSHVWKVGGKVFAIGGWQNDAPSFTFKVSETAFEMLKERPG